MSFVDADTPTTVRRSGELMYAPSEAIFGAVAEGMVALGWSVFPQEKDGQRMPGKVGGEVIRWQADHQLADRLPSPEALRDWTRWCSTLNVAVVMGPASGGALAVDIDVTDPDHACALTDLAWEVLGGTPFIREGMAPKLALIYRGDGIRSETRHFDNPAHGAVEILAAGRPLTCHGHHHKTGRYFVWLDQSPILVGPQAAPVVTQEQVDTFMRRAGELSPWRKPATAGGPVEWVAEAGGVAVPDLRSKAGAKWVLNDAGKVSDGREAFLHDLVFRVATARAAAGIVDRDALVAEVASSAAEAFTVQAVMSGRWAVPHLRRQCLQKAAAVVDKILNGEIAPARRMPRPSFMQPRPEDRVQDDQPTETKQPQKKAAMKIEIITGEIEATVSQAEAALIRAERGLYQMGGAIVQIGARPMKTHAGDELSAQRVFDVGPHALLEHMSSTAEWVRPDPKDSSKQVRCNPPMWVANTLMERAGRLRLPVLAAVVNAPTIRPDGTVLDQPGYDARTGILFDPGSQRFPSVPAHPTKRDAQRALGVLRGMISTFPFVSPEDEAVALSSLITPLVRQAFGTAPAHALSAPTPSTGKSKLIDMSCILLTGKAAGVTEFTSDPAEMEKRLSAELLGGATFIAIDNVTEGTPFDGAFLNQLMTQQTVKPRVLGRSEKRELSTSVSVFANGNNLAVAGDMCSRTLLGILDAKCADPEKRKFEKDALDVARDMRGEAVAAALTIVRAYIVAGRPNVGGEQTRFPGWQRWVRDALLWAGAADAAKTMDRAKANDPKRNSLTSVLTWWNAVLGTKRVTTADVIAAANKQDPGHAENGWKSEYRFPAFREVLLEVAAGGGGGVISPNRLGRWIGGIVERRADGLRVVRLGLVNGQPTWQLARDAEEGAEKQAA